jgi:hypothetical protein
MYQDFHTTWSWLDHANLPHYQASSNDSFCTDKCSITGTYGPSTNGENPRVINIGELSQKHDWGH